MNYKRGLSPFDRTVDFLPLKEIAAGTGSAGRTANLAWHSANDMGFHITA